ncbi:hypothetical protein EVAR_2690_1 [Eumeta japonica]|uniref:Uncharacterized protein n=1 Tax=Eumeta variegata TaxID=151549 RepID=A0A4C1SMB5_EUMVA|nr:hypothetical protein EVAR_2690_1 [Eumeta japonica]
MLPQENTKQAMPEGTKDIVIESSESQLQTIPKPKPSQSAFRNKIVVLESELNSFLLARDIGVATNEAIKRTATLRKDIQQRKKHIEAKALKIRDSVGQPRVEENQSGILEVIKEIAIFGGAADDRCHTETIRCCKTLDDLQAELCKEGYAISRSGLYLKLLPRRANTEEGKRHIVTVPVKYANQIRRYIRNIKMAHSVQLR